MQKKKRTEEYEKLITALYTCADNNKECSECPYEKKCLNGSIAMDAANAIEELLAFVKGYTRSFLNKIDKEEET